MSVLVIENIYDIILQTFPAITEEEVQSFINKNDETLRAFLDGNDPNKLIILNTTPTQTKDTKNPIVIHAAATEAGEEGTEGEEKRTRLRMASENDVELVGTGLYFIRLEAKPVPKKVDRFNEAVIHGVIPAESIQGLFTLLTHVYTPVLENQEDWGKSTESQAKDFLTTVSRFSETLSQIMAFQTPELTLRKPDMKYLTSNVPKSIIKSRNNEVMVAHFEEVVREWIRQVNELLAEKSEDNKSNDIGPKAEIEYWKTRYAKLNSIQEQLKEDINRVAIGVLKAAKKQISKDWNDIDIHITDATNEAKDNVKYLSTLEKYIEPLYNGTPLEIIDILPGLLKNIGMMHSIARYYNTTERMTELFVKMTNQMIQNCKNTLHDHGRLWDQDTQTLIRNLKLCIKLNDEYQQMYRVERDKLSRQPKGKQFNFNYLEIFGKFELFCSRVQTLIELFSTIEQFKQLKRHQIDGMEANVNKFFSYVAELKRKSANLLDYTKNSFDNDYIAFNKKVSHLEQSLQVFINTSFEYITSSEHALKLLARFQSILQRDSLKSELENKYTVIFHNYGLQLENVQKIYEQNKTNPPMLRNAPPVAGNIIWARQLMRRIEDPMNKFQDIPAIMNSKESKKIIKMYNKVLRALFKFETLWLKAWHESIERAKAGLQATLIVENNGDYYVNFDREIFKLLQETKWLMRLNVPIPSDAAVVLMQESKFVRYYNQLAHSLSEYKRLIGMINPIILPLVKPHIQHIRRKLEPGRLILTWTSMNVEDYLKSVAGSLTQFDELVHKLENIVSNRIEKNLMDIRNMLLVSLPMETFSIEHFLDIQEKHIKKMRKKINIKNIEVEQAVEDMVTLILNANGPMKMDGNHQDVIQEIREHFEQRMLNALLYTTTKSLFMLRERIGNRNKSGYFEVVIPFFSVNIELMLPHIMLSPSLDEVQDALNHAAKLVLSCSSKIDAWKFRGEDAAQFSFYEEVAKDKTLIKVIMLLTGGVYGLKKQVEEYLQNFLRYTFLWREDKHKAYERFLERCDQQPTLANFETELKKYLDVEQEINLITNTYNIGSLSLNTTHLKQSLSDHAASWKSQYAKNLHHNAKSLLEKMMNEIEESQKKMGQPIETLESLRFVMDVLKDVREKSSMIDFRFREVSDQYAILRTYGVEVPKDEQDKVYDLSFVWNKLTKAANEVNDKIAKVQGSFKKELVRAVMDFKVDVIQFRNDFESHGPMVSNIEPQEAMERLKKYKRRYAERKRRYDTYRAGEELFGLPQSDYPQLSETEQQLNFLQQLYSLYMEVIERVNSYEDLLWVELDFQAITDEVDVFATRCRLLPTKLRTWPAYQKLRKTIDDFLELQPLLEKLSDDSMRNRHWKQIEDKVGKEFKKSDEEFKLKHILEAEILNSKEDIEEISICARKEADIEKRLNEVAEEWKDMDLTFAEHQNRGFIILKGQETSELMEQLEDTQMTVGSLMGSRYVGPFREYVQSWMKKLTSVTEVLEQWMIVQAMWMYMEAVFRSGDISKQLPASAKKFASIDRNWVRILMKANATPNVIRFCYDNEMLNNLPFLKEQLEDCQKSLAGYLGQKRDIFPRFYFNSDPVLLEILSQSSEPTSIQPHLNSIFDSIERITFDERQPKKIVSMEDASGEVVPFSHAMIAEGNVEDWLQGLERTMQQTMRDIIRRCARECHTLSIHQLIEEYPAQVALLGIQFIWTADCEEAINKSRTEKKALSHNLSKISRILTELSTLTTSELSAKDRTKIETLVTIQVHQRDVFKKIKEKKNKIDVSDFEWQRQARFYWRSDRDTAMIWIADSENEYCYEYLGCKERLVITPLTDRCYITLTQALGLKLGGAPAGPAGTGKTETVKDLGRALGKYVIVLNCSDQMDYRAMAKIYKGIAQSGAWGDFDEFNRIELEVLSVVAQQIQSILTALREMVKKFTFTDGSICKLKPGIGIFITMNPGYQGRQELPENLKVLFRGVAMMVPDREEIIRVKLASCGYLETAELAKKFNTLYTLCEQQLSKQNHYDFGLRNILSVLRTAGATKRKEPKETESYLLMRTLRDMNTSKLVADDVPLFLSLIRDLFPGLRAEKRSYPKLETEIVRLIEEKNLINHPTWFAKIIQLYETALVRHGIMVVGPTGSGKSRTYEVLLDALSALKPVQKQFRMFPKAITPNQMFGKLDIIQNEWTDGIFSALFKIAAKVTKQNIWIICDGPVDAIWIENLNTVLDDNKLLTLANGDRIPMSATMKMCFEVENLDNASPATVSRAGQIYMSSSVLGWKPPLGSYLKGNKIKDEIVRPFNDEQTKMVSALFNKYMEEGLTFVLKQANPVMVVTDQMIVMTCVELLNALVSEHSSSKRTVSQDHLNNLFIFAYAWSLGGVLEQDDREALSNFMSKHFAGAFEGSIWDLYVSPETGNFEHWDNIVEDWIYPENDVIEFTSLYIPTKENVRTGYLIDLLQKRRKNVLLIGGTGTAKTSTIEHYVRQLNPEKMAFKKINFSSATTNNLFQSTIESVIEKRFRAFGPPGGKTMTVFVDDINMPDINEWGDQTTNEIVRQLIEMGGFYSLDKPGDWMQIEDCQYIAAMSHPGGGKNDIPNRLKRHFNIFNVTLPLIDSIEQMFGPIISGRYNEENGFGEDFVTVIEKITPVTVEFWKLIQKQMLPTPKKFHYSFNLRDLSRVYQGIMLPPKELMKTPDQMIDLWRHECTRVFSDRLNDVKDKIWFDENLNSTIGKHFGEEFNDKSKKVYWCNFMRDPVVDEDTGEIIEKAENIYEQTPSVDFLRNKLYKEMEAYNETHKVGQLDLVLFDAAIKHLVRISRIISMPRGNALLVGVGGSGKQSLTRLASQVAGYITKQISLTKNYNERDFFEDLRDLYKLSGHLGNDVTFIFTDKEVKDETFLEYINSILSSGEVAGLFAKDDLDPIISDLRMVAKRDYPKTIGKNDTWDNLYKFFINRVRDKLHIVLCFSPVGNKFRTRALRFPALVSGCTINWFFPWPENALVDVANKFLSDFEIQCSDDVKEQLIKHMGTVHSSMSRVSEKYFERYRRHVYTTPKSYLSFLNLYRTVYKRKFETINAKASKVNGGLQVLSKAGEDVEELQIQLADKEVKLEVAQRNTEKLLVDISARTEEAEKRKVEVESVANVLRNDQEIIAKGKASAEEELAAAKPALEAALKALESITAKDIAFIRGLPHPPFLVKLVLDAVLVLRMGNLNKPKMVKDKNGNVSVQDSWEKSKRMMNQPGFLRSLMNFDKEAINDETIELLQPYLTHPDFNVQDVKKVSEAAAGLCTWIRAMETYTVVAKDVKPKMARLRESESKLRVATAKLQAKQSELARVQSALDEVQRQLDDAKKKKQDLEDDAVTTRKFMEQANNLINALEGERVRWMKERSEFERIITNLTGDVALSTAFISYCGPFNAEFRKLLLRDVFHRDCERRGVPVSKNVNVTEILTDQAQIGEWNIEGLPTDPHSIQNAIMLTTSSKWSLLVDPQGQGLTWLKRREEKNNVVVARLNDKRFNHTLETCMSQGYPLIIENVPESIDPMLDPVLDKNIIRVGKILQIVMNEEQKDYDENFKLFLTTNLPNPHFSPELYAKTTVIDFSVTMKGLEEQLLGYVIQKEKAELEEQRESLLQDVNAYQKRKASFEDELLKKLASVEGNLLEDRELIGVLSATKKAAAEVQDKLDSAEETQERIHTAREEYRPVAIRGSVLYFLIVEMSLVNPMYQTSLKQFLNLFDRAIDESERVPIAAQRIRNISETATYSIFEYVSIGLFKRHKFLFVLLLACKILLRNDDMTPEAFSCLLKGGASLDIKSIEPRSIEWLNDQIWLNVIQLSQSVPVFENLPKMIQNRPKLWKIFYDEEKPECSPVPELNDKITTFEKLLLIRALREDRMIVAAYEFIRQTLGEVYTDTIPVDLESIWNSSSNTSPLVCLLSPGSDPTSMIEALAKKQKTELTFISMGQGQEDPASELISAGFENGNWVLLQNCHLGLKFMATIEDTISEASAEGRIHPDFRLWITSEPNPKFPIGLLQMAIKLTLEGDVGLKANMKSSFQWISQDMIEASHRPEWRRLLYTMCFINSIVQERRKFGPLGWNIPYEFNYADLTASLGFLQNYFASIGDDSKKGPQISWSTINYMICDVHYGGKITDDFDRKLFKTYGEKWLSSSLKNPNFKFNEGYEIPEVEDRSTFVEYIEKMQTIDIPEVFGLHPNADITYRTEQARSVLSTILDVQPKQATVSGNETREQTVTRLSKKYLKRLPKDFKEDVVRDGIRRLGGKSNSLNVFLEQEIERLQKLINIVRKTLTDLQLAIDGTIIMSHKLQDSLDCIFNARVPTHWQGTLSWKSPNFPRWYEGLIDRYTQLHEWLTSKPPKSYWITGFYNPQGFLTAVHQEVTRANRGWALDDVVLKTEVTNFYPDHIKDTVKEGVYIHGLSLEGAGWNVSKAKLRESDPKRIFTQMPVIYITATNDKDKLKRKNVYSCPVYTHKSRSDENYVFNIDLNCTEPKSHWVLRGVALLCAED